MTVHAVKDIAKDDELVDGWVEPWRSLTNRQALLEKHFQFRCRCKACDTSTEFGQASQIRRQKMSELMIQSLKLEQKIFRNLQWVFHSPQRFFQLKTASVTKQQELARLLEEEGIADMHLVDV